jgi:hypothetical protein
MSAVRMSLPHHLLVWGFRHHFRFSPISVHVAAIVQLNALLDEPERQRAIPV